MFNPYFNQKAARNGSGINASLNDAGETALHRCVLEGRARDLDRLLKAGADVNQPDNSGATPLFTAVAAKDFTSIEKLLRAGAKIGWRNHEDYTALESAFAKNIDPLTLDECLALGLSLTPAHTVNASDTDHSALHVAITTGRSDLIAYLCGRGVNVNGADNSGKTALHLACEKGDQVAIHLLLSQGADPLARDAVLNTPLMIAAKNGDLVVADILLAQPKVAQTIDDHRCIDNGWTPLLVAVEAGHIAMVRRLVAAGANPNLRDNENRHSLFIAVAQSTPDMMRALIALGADVSKVQRSSFNDLHLMHVIPDQSFAEKLLLLHAAGIDINAQDGSGQTALHIACEANDPVRAGALLALGADPQKPNEFGKRPLDCVMEHYFYIHEDQRAIVAKLLARGADPNLAPDPRVTMSPLAAAARGGQVTTVQLLLDYKARVDETGRADPDTQTPFMIACAFGRLEVAQLLLKEGAYVQKRDQMQRTALHLAAARGEREIINWLLELPGFSPDLQDAEGKTALHYAAAAGNRDVIQALLNKGADAGLRDVSGWTALHMAARDGYEQAMSVLLKAPNALRDINATVAGSDETALHLAARKGHDEAIGLLLAHGADAGRPSASGHLPLTYAIFSDRLAAAEKLLNALQRQKMDLTILRDKTGSTPLHYAAARAQTQLAALFIAAGLDLNATNHDGNTPLHMAALTGRADTVAYLAGEKGALHIPNSNGQTPLDLALARGHAVVAARLEALQPKDKPEDQPEAPTQAKPGAARRPPL